jgi:hypothetical protein
LANARVNRALKDIQLIGNLSNRSNYQYTDSDIERIFKALGDELKASRGKFAAGAGGSGPTFSLD